MQARSVFPAFIRCPRLRSSKHSTRELASVVCALQRRRSISAASVDGKATHNPGAVRVFVRLDGHGAVRERGVCAVSARRSTQPCRGVSDALFCSAAISSSRVRCVTSPKMPHAGTGLCRGELSGCPEGSGDEQSCRAGPASAIPHRRIAHTEWWRHTVPISRGAHGPLLVSRAKNLKLAQDRRHSAGYLPSARHPHLQRFTQTQFHVLTSHRRLVRFQSPRPGLETTTRSAHS